MIRRRRALRHLEDDLRDHIERETRENLERGMTAEEAHAAALRKFGNVTRVMEDTRAVWTWLWLEQLLQDIRYGLRGLRRNPGFATVVVLTLALGIGMNTAVFSLVNSILIKPLAYPNADRLLWLTDYQRVFKVDWVTGADYADWSTQAHAFDSFTAYDYLDRTIATADRAEQHRVAEVTADLWGLAGVRPALGRLFTSQDRAVVVLSDRLFEQEFHGDSQVIGRQITVGGVPPAWRASTATIVGVLPKGFRFQLPLAPNLFGTGQVDTGGAIEAFIPDPIGWEHPARGPGNRMLPGVVGKLKPGVPIERARIELEAIQAGLARAYPRQGYDRMTLRVLPPGFAPEHVLALNLSLSGPRYRDMAGQRRYVEEALQRVEAAPGVRAAGIIVGFAQGWMQPVHGPPLPADRAPSVKFYAVSPDTGRALGMRLVRGRWLTDQEPQPVVLINEGFARALFGKANPVGQPVFVPADPGQSNTAVVAGVVGDLKYSRLDVNPEPEVYVPYQLLHSATLMVRTASDAAPMAAVLQKVVANIDRTQPVYEVKTLEQALAQSAAPLRFNLYLLGIFAGSAVPLALIGIYGVMAYAVAQRIHEIGVRMALGAQRREVVRLVLREGMTLAGAGITVGLAAAFGFTRLMSSLLYDVKPNDPGTYAVVAGALAATALAACWKPALRAARVDPARALREE